MSLRRLIPVFVLAAAATGASAQYVTTIHPDRAGDAVVRRTDSGGDGPLLPGTVLPDIIELRLSGWHPTDVPADPFTGDFVTGSTAHVFRLDLELAGLINPPGTLGLGGLPYDPFRFGPSPLMGFIELSTDRDEGTGGQLGGAANLRFLANVGRFGVRPYGDLAYRAAESAEDLDLSFYTGPQVERSGEDFSLVMCGCQHVTIVSQSGDGDGQFEAGETWVVRSRFFERAAGYQSASAMFGGSAGGLYDPLVNVRFSHDQSRDVTTVSLVFPLTPTGAAQLAVQPIQPIDLNAANHVSIQEGVQDLIDAANYGSLSGPVYHLTERWEGERSGDDLDPTRWEVTGLVGTAYATPQDSLYVWTDVGFELTPLDLTGDRMVTTLDEDAFDAFLAGADGSGDDGDGVVNGTFVIQNFGVNFSMYDLNGDGVVDGADRDLFTPPCSADLDGDLDADVFDLLAYLDLWFAGDAPANLDADPQVNVFDLLIYLDGWFGGC